MQDEESLVGQAKQGDQQAFAQLYEAYFDRVYRYVALKIGDRTEAEDMTQQVFLKALQSISSYKWRGVPFSAWLFRIAHNQIVDYFRRKAKRPATDLEKSPEVGTDPDHVHTLEEKLDMERLAVAAKKLTPAQQEVLSLRFASELSVAEVAQVMGRKEGAIKALQHSAVVSLRRILLVNDNE